MSETASYWTRRTRRGFLAGAGGVAGLAGLALAGCGGGNSKKPATATAARTAASQAATSAAAGTPSGPSAGTAAPAAAVASGTRGPTGADLAKLSDQDFFAALPQNPPKDWSDADIKTGGRWVLLSGWEGTWDPHATTGGYFTNEQPIYSELIRLSPAQGLKTVLLPVIEGDLATKWEKPDNASIIFTLAPNIKWQNKAPLNGRPFAVDDIRFTYQRGATYAKSVYKADFQAISKVEAVGNDQVRLTWANPNPLIDQIISIKTYCILPPEIAGTPDLLETNPIGTGGFQLNHHTPNVEAVFDRNPDFFKTDAQGRKKPYTDGFTIQYVTDPSTAQNIFLARQADWGIDQPFGSDPISGVRTVQRQLPNVTLQKLPTAAGALWLQGKWSDPVWQDVRFRRAMSMLLPRDQVISAVFKGQGYPGPHYPWAYLFDTQPTVKDLGPWWQYNPGEAKKLLDAAGLLSRSFDVEYYPTVYGGENQLVVLQQEAASIGLKLNLQKTLDSATMYGHLAGKSYKDMITGLRGVQVMDPWDTTRDIAAGNSQNSSGIDDPVVNDLFSKLADATGDTRKQIGKQLWDRMLDQVYQVALVGANNFFAFQPRIKNFVGTTWSPHFSGLGAVDGIWLDPTAKA